MKLTPKNVTISTATVEIRMLTLDGKHLTQAIYRQLPRYTPWAEDGSTEAVPWGRVSHCIPAEERKFLTVGHLHIVWQYEDLLFRSLEEPSTEDILGPDPSERWKRLCALPQLFIGR